MLVVFVVIVVPVDPGVVETGFGAPSPNNEYLFVLKTSVLPRAVKTWLLVMVENSPTDP